MTKLDKVKDDPQGSKNDRVVDIVQQVDRPTHIPVIVPYTKDVVDNKLLQKSP
jgi:hypothetical protein